MMKLNAKYVAVRPVKDKSDVKTEGGLFLPGTGYADENPCIGEIVALGLSASEEFQGISGGYEGLADFQKLNVGDKVLYPRGVSTAYYDNVADKESKICLFEARHIYAVLS
jgi:co-chaperonin GroES (HSP10)